MICYLTLRVYVGYILNSSERKSLSKLATYFCFSLSLSNYNKIYLSFKILICSCFDFVGRNVCIGFLFYLFIGNFKRISENMNLSILYKYV